MACCPCGVAGEGEGEGKAGGMGGFVGSEWEVKCALDGENGYCSTHPQAGVAYNGMQ